MSAAASPPSEGPIARWFFGPVPKERLALLRIAVAAFALIYLGARTGHFLQVAHYGAADFVPLGPVRILSQPLPSAVVYALHFLTLLACAAACVGFRYRITGPLFALGVGWVCSYRNCWGMIFHTDNLLVLHALVLGLAPSAAQALSWDARSGSGPGERLDQALSEAPSADGTTSAWPIQLMCLLTVLAYLLAGIAKLRLSGLGWSSGDVLREHIAYDAVRKIELGSIHSPLGAWLVTVPWVFPPIAWLTLLFELGAPLALFSRRLARWWCGIAFGFHAGVLALMAIVFAYPLCGVAFFSFFPLEAFLQTRLGRRFAKIGASPP